MDQRTFDLISRRPGKVASRRDVMQVTVMSAIVIASAVVSPPLAARKRRRRRRCNPACAACQVCNTLADVAVRDLTGRRVGNARLTERRLRSGGRGRGVRRAPRMPEWRLRSCHGRSPLRRVPGMPCRNVFPDRC